MTTTTNTTVIKHTYKVGDDVSYGFNGDWYPAGKIVSFSKSGRYMTTDRGDKFTKKVYNIRNLNPVTDRYEDMDKEYYVSQHGGTWTVCHGVVHKQNPHF